MKIEPTSENTCKIAWDRGEIEVNLAPVNSRLAARDYGPGFATASFGGQLITLRDCVGIVGLRIQGCPPVPRICWDNREHHFWSGFNGGFRPRNTVVNDIGISHSDDNSSAKVSYFYVADHVKTTVSWLFTEPTDDGVFVWDTCFSVENLHDRALEKYMALFACYHEPGRNFYWDERNEIAECTDKFRGCPDASKLRRVEETTAAFAEQVKGWTAGIDRPSQSSVIYGNPVLMSEPREWFDNGRHILMVEPGKCLCVVSAMRQARDYMLAPAETDLAPGALFTARVRHVIARIDDMPDLRRHWDRFTQDIASR